jgi:hypothetical protein
MSHKLSFVAPKRQHRKDQASEAKGAEVKTKEGGYLLTWIMCCGINMQHVDGWVWRGLSRLGVKDDALRKWEEKGQSLSYRPSSRITRCTDNSIKFFRSEAEFQRWQEQVEIKHAELHRSIKYFAQFETIWLEAAEAASSPGHAAYVRRTAAMYGGLKADVVDVLKRVGLPEMRKIPDGSTLADQVLAWRERELADMSKKYR